MPTTAELKDIILNVRTPHIIKYKDIFDQQWKCFDKTFESWASSFDANAENIPNFDTGTIKFSSQPQWERHRKTAILTMTKFLQSTKEFMDRNEWYSYSYKPIEKLPAGSSEDVNFSILGFPGIKEKISFWIGSRYAHTPCHYDSYGCNIVVQVYGRKSWLLFPPGTRLHEVRVPYEESSIYCKENFYSPSNYCQFKDIESEAHHIILEAGDVLIVPHKWWHYVETLEPSLNFNSWIELDDDLDSQIDECLSKILFKQYISDLPETAKRILVNPNERDNIEETDEQSLHNILDYLLNLKQSHKKQSKDSKYECNYLSQTDIDKLVVKYNDIVFPVEKLNAVEFFEMMKVNSTRYDPNMEDNAEKIELNLRMRQAVIEVICQNDLIQLIKDEILS